MACFTLFFTVWQPQQRPVLPTCPCPVICAKSNRLVYCPSTGYPAFKPLIMKHLHCWSVLQQDRLCCSTADHTPLPPYGELKQKTSQNLFRQSSQQRHFAPMTPFKHEMSRHYNLPAPSCPHKIYGFGINAVGRLLIFSALSTFILWVKSTKWTVCCYLVNMHRRPASLRSAKDEGKDLKGVKCHYPATLLF